MLSARKRAFSIESHSFPPPRNSNSQCKQLCRRKFGLSNRNKFVPPASELLTNTSVCVCRKVEIKLRNILDGREVVVDALEIDEISRASIRDPDRDICAEMEYKGLALTFDFKELSSDGQISLLVGADYYWDLIKGIQRSNSSLEIIETIFGWSLQGRCDELTDSTLVNFVLSEKESLSAKMRRFLEVGKLRD
ncbi:DUF1758 domain-containing protein [Nephila pilipes]|uniref:DUF1758 domain-containing protein n=1 Tax=Nephila pilipes TaxID=299642 RepID=A0A8X6R4H0_NEPPI|nr:DUF1758 domain-containing protein [Nephila pilipes]